MSKKVLKVGVNGFHARAQDKVVIWNLISRGFDRIMSETGATELHVISSLSDSGVPQAAYHIARQRGWNCGGIAPKAVMRQRIFPMNVDGDIMKIVGNRWGDESEAFINECDVLLRVGNSRQSMDEAELAEKQGKKVFVNLPKRR